MKTWTYGAELELSDCERDTPLPEKAVWDKNDYTIVNSNGVANDPKAILWKFGGEINTGISNSPEEQAEHIKRVFDSLRPSPVTNYRSNLHIHIRVPGLESDVVSAKRILAYYHQTGASAFQLIDPLPEKPPSGTDAMKRWTRRKKSHHYFLTEARLQQVMKAETMTEFKAFHAPLDYCGTPMFHLVQRCGVNLLALFKHGTIEFRHFCLTTNMEEVYNALRWCQVYLESALGDQAPPQQLLWKDAKFPYQPLFDSWLEKRYRASSRRYHSEETVKAVIEQWRKDGTL